MRDSDSVAVYFLNAMLHALRDCPAERDAHCVRWASTRTCSTNRRRGCRPAFAELWLAMIRRLDDEFFRLDSHGMPLGSFALICRGLILEPNLERLYASAWQALACSCTICAAA